MHKLNDFSRRDALALLGASAALFAMPRAARSEPTDKELKMARLLIDTLSGPFEPERFPDEHRRRLLEAIEAKAPLPAVAATPPSPTRVLDLMAALEASVKAAKAARTKEDRQTKVRRRRSTGS